jgi:hypothetical protein
MDGFNHVVSSLFLMAVCDQAARCKRWKDAYLASNHLSCQVLCGRRDAYLASNHLSCKVLCGHVLAYLRLCFVSA